MQQRAPKARIVVVDPSSRLHDLSRRALGPIARVDCVAEVASAKDEILEQNTQLALVNWDSLENDVFSFFEFTRRHASNCETILVGSESSSEHAATAMRLGAADYLAWPIHEEELAFSVWRALARQQLAEENRSLRDRVHTIEVCEPLLRCLEVGEVYPQTLDVLLSVLQRDQGLAFFHRSSLDISDAVAFRGIPEAIRVSLREVLVDEKRLDPERFCALEVIQHGELIDLLREHQLPVSSILSIPLRGPETESGVIWIFQNNESHFEETDLFRAELVAKQAQVAIHNAEHYNHAKEKAFVDDVTDLYNARYLHKATEHEINRAERYGHELSVLFLDIDRFKLVNDQHGHLIGSQTLRRLGQVLQSCVRQVDTLARYGGDEFTVLLVDAGGELAMAIAERIRKAVGETLFDGGAGGALQITLSIGVATYPNHATSREALLDLADKAMYRAKSLGRNRVCSVSELEAEPPGPS